MEIFNYLVYPEVLRKEPAGGEVIGELVENLLYFLFSLLKWGGEEDK